MSSLAAGRTQSNRSAGCRVGSVSIFGKMTGTQAQICDRGER
ncbi:hypothetical protein PhaeoP75_00608 [Phaeobacter gallaeciensis]|uniref:Uncharacterized protein n=1 Tax=Phaeobacter gallaeciensis TaxID=60890 RepID=A0AAC9Z752_9RHOB|nr:hypothetical protein Gal_00611 [Phaeobacter gallaeciensis DSM 26640]ATE91662.1 hypothetical protein PhaeoP11_00607 [Phaeobacter gallaeciensis]ATE98514.1 hypothetical protein PhaeoP73_03237 [Phaeobacter gallaeciensis]ATF00278.1 hypothetical protein PhaeoP75_00608 [Phaeobacter gallaeciensis]ATF04710.1 hypothetical protein PhaeoP63_00608 [Phaeobacter gallaeciensis]